MNWMRVLFSRKSDLKKRDVAAREDEDGQSNESGFELTHVDRYEILAQVGSGGMGTVYKAIDRERDVTVAIKVLDRRYDLDKKRRKRDYLGREVLIAAKLSHENIIRMSPEIIEQEDINGNVRRCILMEYIDGNNLWYFIQNRVLTLNQMIDLCIKLSHGLDFLHQNGVIHRDIKPHNFLFSRDMKKVKIVDFGLSKANTSWRTRWFKEGGGTRRYMSPEQLAKQDLNERSDIFSFGITLYELFTGQHPCSGKGNAEIQRQLRSKNYKFDPPSKHNREIPPQLDRIILKALRRSPESRYQSVTEMLMDLTRIAESRI